MPVEPILQIQPTEKGPAAKFTPCNRPLVEISGIEPLLFVCLKDSQTMVLYQKPTEKKRADLAVDSLVEISGVEVLLFVCLKDSQERKRPTFRLVLVEISGIEPLTS